MISKYLFEKNIFFIDTNSREEALRVLVNNLNANKQINNPKAFLEAILQREQIVSTGIGMGVAIPHAKLADYNDFFIAIGIQKRRSIDWDSIDKYPVKLIFMIGGPDNEQTKYLKILSHLTTIIRDEKIRRKLFRISKRNQLLNILNLK